MYTQRQQPHQQHRQAEMEHEESVRHTRCAQQIRQAEMEHGELVRRARCIQHYPGHYRALFKNLVEEEEPWYQSPDGQHCLYRGCTTRIGVTDGTNFVLAGTACYLVLVELMPVKRSKRAVVRPDTHSAHVYYVQHRDNAQYGTSPVSVYGEDSHTVGDLMVVARNNSTINRIKKTCLAVKCEWSIPAKRTKTSSESDDETAC